MTDITKCADPELRKCILMDTCYRNTAASSPHNQSWQDFAPNSSNPETYCDHYIPTGTND